jgi:glutamate racemase
VAAQALRRLGPAAQVTGGGRIEVVLNGRPGALPAEALAYAEGACLVTPATA